LLSLGGHEWRMMFAVNAIPALAQALVMAKVPSSPYSLVTRGRPDEARESLIATRHRDDVDAELDSIVAAHQRAANATPTAAFKKRPLRIEPSLRRPIMIAMGAAMMDTLVGIGAIVYYSTAVFSMAGVGGRAGAEIASWSIGVVNVVSTVAAVGLLSRYGRRPLLTVGLSGIAVAMLTTGLGLMSSSGPSGAIAIVGMLAFMACHAFSAGPIGWLLVAEVLPARIRCRASAAAIGVNWFANLVVALLFPVLAGSPGEPRRAAIGFFVFAAISVGFLVFVRVYVPETKGLSLAEVEAKLTDRNTEARNRGRSN
jgi:MFS family permease